MSPQPQFGSQFYDSVVQDGRIGLVVGAARPVRWPHRIGTVPPLAASRQEREADGLLHESTASCLVLAGMGGVGKTQLAAAYATSRWDASELDLLMWVNASGSGAVTAAFAQAGVELCGAEPGHDGRAAAAFLNLLTRTDGPRWLIVLDDLADPVELYDIWPPHNPRGRTIITTRRRDAALDGMGRIRIDIGLFSAAESLAYLHQRLGPRSKRIAGAEALSERLAGLPLALAQASAFILDQPGLTCGDYVDLLEDRTIALAELSPETAPDGYRGPLGAAWSLSIEQADRQRPQGLALGLLRLVALLDPAGVPADLFGTEAALRHLAAAAGASALPAFQVRAALGRLHRLSLIDTDGSLVRMHALVQRAVADTATAEQERESARAAADALAAVWPDPESDPSFSAVLRSNAMRLFAKAASLRFADGVPPVLFRLGDSFGTQGQVHTATRFYVLLAEQARAAFGPDHFDTLQARHGCARWRGEAGDVLGAIEGFTAVLADRVRVLGPDDPKTLSTRQRLLYWKGEKGDLEAAAAETETLLADRRRVLGPEHFDVLVTRSLRARWQGRSGDAHGAAEANEALLADCLRLLGADHPFTLAVRHNLAHWRGDAGDPEGAASATAALLADRERVLGADHPDTLRSRQNLAGWLGESGDAAAAVEGLKGVLDDQLRILGPEHPDVIAVRNDLARWTARIGGAAAAVEAFSALRDDCRQLLGDAHRYTGIIEHNLAHWTARLQSELPPGVIGGGAQRATNVGAWGDGGFGSNGGQLNFGLLSGGAAGGRFRIAEGGDRSLGGMMGVGGPRDAVPPEAEGDIGTWLTEDEDVWGLGGPDEDPHK
ncbi:tetratricopeptide repeat protein [Glycomyces dulcitolivorans]|uniref:tetratricopeptide repeat protein n=1 Tax=Glycomyces dulcitolivorans TaxID=2200759 RepID=UPI000DD2F14D|nr:tetratricopeptide repeat protein [Glycomyces dulcitolivorans]